MYNNPEMLFGGKARLFDLIALVYGAVDEPHLWSVVLEEIAEAVNSGCTFLFADSERCAQGSLLALARTEPAYLALYAQHYSSVNILADVCDRMFPEGTIRYSHIAVPDFVFEKSEFYNDYLRAENYFYSCGIKIAIPDEKPAYLSTVRSRHLGPYTPEEGVIWTTLRPHLSRALKLHFQFTELRSSMGAVVEHIQHGLAWLDTTGRCLQMNRPAQELVDRKDGLVLSGGKLAAEDLNENRQLRRLVACALEADTGGLGAMSISRRKRRPLQVVVTPHRFGLLTSPFNTAAVIEIYDPESTPATSSKVYQSLYGLTNAEARLGALLVEGHDLAEAAAILQVTKETVRSQLKQVFQKTGTRRQAELVRLLGQF